MTDVLVGAVIFLAVLCIALIVAVVDLVTRNRRLKGGSHCTCGHSLEAHRKGDRIAGCHHVEYGGSVCRCLLFTTAADLRQMGISHRMERLEKGSL